MKYYYVNWALLEPEELPEIHDGDEFIGGTILQFSLRKVFEGIKNLIFIDVNLINCDLHESTETIGCNTAINKYVVEEDDEIKI